MELFAPGTAICFAAPGRGTFKRSILLSSDPGSLASSWIHSSEGGVGGIMLDSAIFLLDCSRFFVLSVESF